MNLLGIQVAFTAALLLLPMMALTSELMDYLIESSKVLKCENICSSDENFVPAIPNSNGSCPGDPKKIDLSKPLILDQICDLDNLNPIDGYGNELEEVINICLIFSF